MKITFQRGKIGLRIFINDILHLAIKYDSIICIHAYIMKRNYYIEVVTKQQTITLSYSTKSKWERILEILTKQLE